MYQLSFTIQLNVQSMQRILNQKWWVWPRNLISIWGAFCLMREELIYFSSYERSYTRKQDNWLLFAVISYFNAQNRGTSSPRFCLQEALGVLWTLGSLYLSSWLFPVVSALCPSCMSAVCTYRILDSDPCSEYEVLHSTAQTKNLGGHISSSLTLPTHLICQHMLPTKLQNYPVGRCPFFLSP